jgi:hypothetical protein
MNLSVSAWIAAICITVLPVRDSDGGNLILLME